MSKRAKRVKILACQKTNHAPTQAQSLCIAKPRLTRASKSGVASKSCEVREKQLLYAVHAGRTPAIKHHIRVPAGRKQRWAKDGVQAVQGKGQTAGVAQQAGSRKTDFEGATQIGYKGTLCGCKTREVSCEMGVVGPQQGLAGLNSGQPQEGSFAPGRRGGRGWPR